MLEGLILPLSLIFTCLLTIAVSFRYFVHYRLLTIHQAAQRDQNRLRYRLAGAALLLASLVFLAAMFNVVNQTGQRERAAENPAAPGQQATQPAPGSPPVDGASPAPASAPTPTPSPTETPQLRLTKIGNTGGFGANVRSGPGLEYEILATLPDDTPVSLTNESQTAGDFQWWLIILEDGSQGWVAENFLSFEE